MQEKPLATIVTVTFNLMRAGREKYFRQCLESVHNQTYKNIEHIVIDGASTDGTVDLIKEYADKGWIKYISEKDTGIYDAMNKGIKMSKGKYVAFLNSDDHYHGNGGVASSVNELEENNADFSYAPVINLDELSGTRQIVYPIISNTFFMMPFSHQTMFVKKSVIIKENMFNTSFRSAGDYDFIIRMILNRYRGLPICDIFTTFRFGGVSSFNQGQALREISDLYYKNYGKMINITREECSKIYGRGFYGISSDLAKRLGEYAPYFDYEGYLESTRIKNKLKEKINLLFRESCAKFMFVLFSPIKFLKKYKFF